jgi:hypothetical protein
MGKLLDVFKQQHEDETRVERPVNVYVEAQITIAGMHRWINAPLELHHLRYEHRHLFVIRAIKQVDHGDRETEFQLLGARIEGWLSDNFPRTPGLPNTLAFGGRSCEALAEMILHQFNLWSCSVHEDGENGAHVVLNGSEMAARRIANVLR